MYSEMLELIKKKEENKKIYKKQPGKTQKIKMKREMKMKMKKEPGPKKKSFSRI